MRSHGLTLWDLDRTFNVGGFADRETMTLRDVLTTHSTGKTSVRRHSIARPDLDLPL